MEREPKVDPQQVELERPQRENEEMQEQLRRAETIIEIQKSGKLQYLFHSRSIVVLEFSPSLAEV